MLVVPPAPAHLRLPLERSWDGSPSPRGDIRGWVALSAARAGLEIGGGMPERPDVAVPAAPSGTRVPDLWRYDVVECFLVGGGGDYLEVELGAGGHFLVLGFEAPRVRSREHRDLHPELAFAREDGAWRSRIVVPWDRVPEGVRALNAFALAGGAYLAHAPVPGDAPDFHQPGAFPAARISDPA